MGTLGYQGYFWYDQQIWRVPICDSAMTNASQIWMFDITRTKKTLGVPHPKRL